MNAVAHYEEKMVKILEKVQTKNGVFKMAFRHTQNIVGEHFRNRGQK